MKEVYLCEKKGYPINGNLCMDVGVGGEICKSKSDCKYKIKQKENNKCNDKNKLKELIENILFDLDQVNINWDQQTFDSEHYYYSAYNKIEDLFKQIKTLDKTQ